MSSYGSSEGGLVFQLFLSICTAEEVLEQFREYFIHAVHARVIITELTYKGIITAAHQEELSQSK